MDKIHAFIEEERKCHNKQTLDDLIQWYSYWSGFPWIIEDAPEEVVKMVEAFELEMRSALEFIRPELSPSQIKMIDSWDKRFKEAVKKGTFYKLYAEAQGDLFTWEDERKEAAEMLGRVIPRSHWWFWPPEKDEKPKKDPYEREKQWDEEDLENKILKLLKDNGYDS